MMSDYKKELALIEAASDGPWKKNHDACGDIFISGVNGEYLFEIGAPDDDRAEADGDYVTYFNPQHLRQLVEAERELERVSTMAFTSTGDAFLGLPDKDKRMVFAVGLRESARRKEAERERDELVKTAFNQAKTIEELKQALGDLMVEHEMPASDYLKELLG